MNCELCADWNWEIPWDWNWRLLGAVTGRSDRTRTGGMQHWELLGHCNWVYWAILGVLGCTGMAPARPSHHSPTRAIFSPVATAGGSGAIYTPGGGGQGRGRGGQRRCQPSPRGRGVLGGVPSPPPQVTPLGVTGTRSLRPSTPIASPSPIAAGGGHMIWGPPPFCPPRLVPLPADGFASRCRSPGQTPALFPLAPGLAAAAGNSLGRDQSEVAADCCPPHPSPPTPSPAPHSSPSDPCTPRLSPPTPLIPQLPG